MPQRQVVQDARGELRVPARLHIELLIDAETSSATGSTINISSNGVYFTSSRYLEPLTVLGMRLLLPGEEGDVAPEAFDVRGVVVRIEPEQPSEPVDGYEVACYFLETTSEFRERLGHYVQSHL
jgi:PilZ domain-containing protein